MEKLKLKTNVPEVIALQFAQGKAVSSPYTGDQVMFTLVDGRVMFLDPFVAEKIHAAEIPARTNFAICKREVSHGNRRTVEYQIETHNATGAPSKDAPPAAEEVTPAISRPTQQTQLTPRQEAPAANLLIATGRAAVDAVLDVEAYAQERGLTDFEFGAENIQKVWMSLFIDAARKGAR